MPPVLEWQRAPGARRMLVPREMPSSSGEASVSGAGVAAGARGMLWFVSGEVTLLLLSPALGLRRGREINHWHGREKEMGKKRRNGSCWKGDLSVQWHQRAGQSFLAGW